MPGNAIESDIMNHTIPLCKVCSSVPAQIPVQKPKKKGKKRNLQPWESDGEEEPDVPELPAGIMKVCLEVVGIRNLILTSRHAIAKYHILWGEAYGRFRESSD